MGISGGIGGNSGIDAVGERRMVNARFGLTKELERTLPLTRLYWARERREWSGSTGASAWEGEVDNPPWASRDAACRVV